MRGATHFCKIGAVLIRFLLTHLLRGATLWTLQRLIYLHFYSRTSCEVRPIFPIWFTKERTISTHAPLARCDRCTFVVLHIRQNFYSRTSCEVRLAVERCDNTATDNFYSRTSCEVRRVAVTPTLGTSEISTHAPLARCDVSVFVGALNYAHFYSRTSCEVRHHLLQIIDRKSVV